MLHSSIYRTNDSFLENSTCSSKKYDIMQLCLYFRYASRVKLITNDASKNSESKEISRLKSVNFIFHFITITFCRNITMKFVWRFDITTCLMVYLFVWFVADDCKTQERRQGGRRRSLICQTKIKPDLLTLDGVAVKTISNIVMGRLRLALN